MWSRAGSQYVIIFPLCAALLSMLYKVSPFWTGNAMSRRPSSLLDIKVHKAIKFSWPEVLNPLHSWTSSIDHLVRKDEALIPWVGLGFIHTNPPPCSLAWSSLWTSDWESLPTAISIDQSIGILASSLLKSDNKSAKKYKDVPRKQLLVRWTVRSNLLLHLTEMPPESGITVLTLHLDDRTSSAKEPLDPSFATFCQPSLWFCSCGGAALFLTYSLLPCRLFWQIVYSVAQWLCFSTLHIFQPNLRSQ